MKKSLFLYLFIIAVLINVFTYSYFTKQNEAMKQSVEASSKKLRDTVDALMNRADDAMYFTLERNANAQDYFAVTSPIEMSIEELVPKVEEQLLSYNDNPEGNPYTGQTKLGSQKFIINKARVLNHRWIIADYSDGNYWGEVMLKYFVNGDNTISFEVMQSLLYQK